LALELLGRRGQVWFAMQTSLRMDEFRGGVA